MKLNVIKYININVYVCLIENTEVKENTENIEYLSMYTGLTQDFGLVRW